MTDWTEFGLDDLPPLPARERVARMPPTLYPSLHPDHLPDELAKPFDGRILSGAYRDYARIDHAGVCATDLSDAQRRLLESLIGTYVGWPRDGHAGMKMAEVKRHLDETWFAWMGATGDDGPFYYRVRSPVVPI